MIVQLETEGNPDEGAINFGSSSRFVVMNNGKELREIELV